MKKIMICLAFALPVSLANAKDINEGACPVIGSMAKDIMKIRQYEIIPREDLTKLMLSSDINAKETELVSQIIEIAYSKPVIEDETERLKWIAKFGYTMENACYDLK